LNTPPVAPDDDIPDWLRGATEENSTTTADTGATLKEKTIEEIAPTDTPVVTP